MFPRLTSAPVNLDWRDAPIDVSGVSREESAVNTWPLQRNGRFTSKSVSACDVREHLAQNRTLFLHLYCFSSIVVSVIAETWLLTMVVEFVD